MTKFAARRPLGYALTMWFAMFVVYIILGGALQGRQVASTTAPILFGSVLSVLGLLVVAGQRWWGEAGFNAPTDWRPYLVLLLMPVINLARGFHADLAAVPMLALAALLVGLNEELWFRGIILRGLAPKGLGWQVWGSAILFGLLHILNGLIGQDLLVSLIQVAYAIVLGLAFALVRLKTHSVWPIMLIHALTDFFAWGAQSGQIGTGTVSTLFDVVLPALVILLFSGYSAYLWRSLKAGSAKPVAA